MTGGGSRELHFNVTIDAVDDEPFFVESSKKSFTQSVKDDRLHAAKEVEVSLISLRLPLAS